MFYGGKNILIAGGGGLMGQSLIRKLLDQGAHVRATYYQSRTIDIQHKNLETMKCDLREEEEASKVFADMDIAFLTAAKVGGAKLIKEDPSSLIMYNLDLHAKLIHWASSYHLDKCCFVSSSYVYPDTGRPNVEAEGFVGDPWIPLNYGLGWIKRYLETLCKHFHMTSSTDYAIVRPTAIYGPYDRWDLESCHVVPALIVKAVDGMNPFEVWGNGEDIRCFTYVDDLTEGMMLTTQKYAVAEGLNICSRESHSVKELLAVILQHIGICPQIVFNSDQPSVIPFKVSDPLKARELIGWEPKFTLEEGIGRTIDWYTDFHSQGMKT